jgi:hypothetical protein
MSSPGTPSSSSPSKFNMKNPAIKRIVQEMKEMRSDTGTTAYAYYAEAVEDDIFEWHFAIFGPEDSEFDGGVYHGRILLPTEYPFKPPSFMLLTPSGEAGEKRKRATFHIHILTILVLVILVQYLYCCPNLTYFNTPHTTPPVQRGDARYSVNVSVLGTARGGTGIDACQSRGGSIRHCVQPPVCSSGARSVMRAGARATPPPTRRPVRDANQDLPQHHAAPPGALAGGLSKQLCVYTSTVLLPRCPDWADDITVS